MLFTNHAPCTRGAGPVQWQLRIAGEPSESDLGQVCFDRERNSLLGSNSADFPPEPGGRLSPLPVSRTGVSVDAESRVEPCHRGSHSQVSSVRDCVYGTRLTD